MKRLITLLIVAFAGIISANAQNNIDKLIDSCQSVGSSRFTSAIERNPDTHQVVKVVKVFESDSMPASKFISTFNEESASASTSSKSINNGRVNHTLTFESDNQIRIYSLSYENEYAHIGLRVTIIVKYLKK